MSVTALVPGPAVRHGSGSDNEGWPQLAAFEYEQVTTRDDGIVVDGRECGFDGGEPVFDLILAQVLKGGKGAGPETLEVLALA